MFFSNKKKRIALIVLASLIVFQPAHTNPSQYAYRALQNMVYKVAPYLWNKATIACASLAGCAAVSWKVLQRNKGLRQRVIKVYNPISKSIKKFLYPLLTKPYQWYTFIKKNGLWYVKPKPKNILDDLLTLPLSETLKKQADETGTPLQYPKYKNFTWVQLKTSATKFITKMQVLFNNKWVGTAPVLKGQGPLKRLFVQKLVLPDNAEIAILGDPHGDIQSIAATIKKLQERGFIDKNNWKKLNPDKYIVGLGDYIDNGLYASEVLYVLWQLHENNPEQVILVRGNHENTDVYINSKNKYATELAAVCPQDAYIRKHVFPTLDKELHEKFKNEQNFKGQDAELLLRTAFTYMPGAVYLQYDNKVVACSHASLPFIPSDTTTFFSAKNLFNDSRKCCFKQAPSNFGFAEFNIDFHNEGPKNKQDKNNKTINTLTQSIVPHGSNNQQKVIQYYRKMYKDDFDTTLAQNSTSTVSLCANFTGHRQGGGGGTHTNTIGPLIANNGVYRSWPKPQPKNNKTMPNKKQNLVNQGFYTFILPPHTGMDHGKKYANFNYSIGILKPQKGGIAQWTLTMEEIKEPAEH